MSGTDHLCNNKLEQGDSIRAKEVKRGSEDNKLRQTSHEVRGSQEIKKRKDVIEIVDL